MAKDPAFLFYPGDWQGGTMLFTRHQKGCYMDILIAQFNNGPLSLESIKAILGQDQATWTVLLSKFKQDSLGNYYNEKLATEVEKRKKFTESRRENIQKRYNKSTLVDTSVVDVKVHMENGNENTGFKISDLVIQNFLEKNQLIKTCMGLKPKISIDVLKPELKLWMEKQMQLEYEYEDLNDFKDHFGNWIRVYCGLQKKETESTEYRKVRGNG